MELSFRAIPVKWNNASLNTAIPSIDEVVYRRFLCGKDSKPQKVYFYFTHVDCCIPNLHIYVSKPGGNSNKDEFVDLLELLTTLGLAQTVQSDVILSHNCRKIATHNSDALFYKPCNFSYYESLMNIKSQNNEDENTAAQK